MRCGKTVDIGLQLFHRAVFPAHFTDFAAD